MLNISFFNVKLSYNDIFSDCERRKSAKVQKNKTDLWRAYVASNKRVTDS